MEVSGVCGHGNPPAARFCGECGAPLMQCSSCGQPHDGSGKYCHHCGTPLRRSDAAGASIPLDAPATIPAVVSTPSPRFLAGERYRVDRFLGEGAKKRVYLSYDTRLEREVALALIKTDGLDEAGLARVRREARAMGRLGDHPNLVTIYDVGEEGTQTYIVSQFIGGGSLAELLAQQGSRVRGSKGSSSDELSQGDPRVRGDENESGSVPRTLEPSNPRTLPMEQVLRLGDHICAALEHAHGCGIVHRDLKPANVWLTADGTAKLGDFGLAVSVDRSRLTVEGMMVGTVAYMPPEQALGQAPDARSDLYALGAVLYEMVTGRLPFLGDDTVSIISQHINTPPVAPSWHNPAVPRALEALILRLLAKAPEDRPENARAVRESLLAISAQLSAAPAPANATSSAEEVNPLDRLAGGIFVGREQEMDQLRAALEDSLSGRGRLTLLVGEPGIGKTRTAEEIVTYARLRKMQVLWGRCYEGDGAPAYWPWVQAIRSYASEHEPERLRGEMGAGAADIAQVVSDVRTRLTDLPAPAPLDPEQARFRFFDSVTTFLKNVAKGQPLVLVLEDLHWADKPSLALLSFLAGELRGTRLLVIGTYRDVELGRQHPLTDTLAQLAREQLSERLVLRGLRERDIARFIEITAGMKPPAPLVAALYKETEGNPFFVNEIVRLLVSDGRLQHPEAVRSWSVGIPQSVREVLGRRLDRLSATCNEVLTVASVMGREFTRDALAAVDAVGNGRLGDALEEAVAARVIVEVPHAVGRYSFAHALVRETLYAELSTTRRLHLHRQIGEQIEQLHAGNLEPHLSELANHFFRSAPAGDTGKAVAYAVRAAERAAALMAHEEAVRHYELALQAVELKQPVDDAQRGELLLVLGQTLWRAGLFAEAKETFMRGVELGRRLQVPAVLARAALGFGGRLPAFETGILDDVLVGVLEEALLAIGPDDSALRAQLMARLAVALTFSASTERRAALAVEAIAMARRVGDMGALSDVLRGAHSALWGLQDVAAQRDLATESLELAAAVGDREAEMEGRIFRISHFLQLGDIARADEELATVDRLVATSGQPYYRWGNAALRVTRALLQGRFGEVEALAQQVLELGQSRGNQNAFFIYAAHVFRLYRDQSRLPDVEASLNAFAEGYPNLPIWRCARALAWCETGRLAEARSEIDRLAPAGIVQLPRDYLWLAGVVFVAEACAMLDDRERAAVLYDTLGPYETQNMMLAPVGDCWGSTARILGRLSAVQGKWEAAYRHFETALALNRRLGSPPWVAQTQYDYAAMLVQRGAAGDAPRAMTLLNDALQAARQLQMKHLTDQALALKLRLQGVASDDWQTSIDAVSAAVQRDRPDLRRQAAPDGTVTLLFSDIENSTAMLERLGDQRAQEVLRGHNELVRTQVQRHGGFVVKSMGDGFMVAFQSARSALLSAIDIQRTLAARNGSQEPVTVRLGLHCGEAIREQDDFYGKAVVLAARIAAQARGGEILVSSVVKELACGASDIAFDAGRPVELKGLSGTYTVHPVRWVQ